MWIVGSVPELPRGCPSHCSLFGCSGSSDDQSKPLFRHGIFVLIERKGKIHCHQHMGNIDLCLYREWFIYYVVISKRACTSREVIIQLCPCWPGFPSGVSFCSSSCEVHVRNQVRVPRVSFRQFVTCMAWQGGGDERNHAWGFQALLRWTCEIFHVLWSGCITSDFFLF